MPTATPRDTLRPACYKCRPQSSQYVLLLVHAAFSCVDQPLSRLLVINNVAGLSNQLWHCQHSTWAVCVYLQVMGTQEADWDAVRQLHLEAPDKVDTPQSPAHASPPHSLACMALGVALGLNHQCTARSLQQPGSNWAATTLCFGMHPWLSHLHAASRTHQPPAVPQLTLSPSALPCTVQCR